jgi:hypothetical protein
MLIRNIITLIIIKIVILFNTVNPLLFCSYFMGDTEREVNSVFDIKFEVAALIYTKLLKSNIYYKGLYKQKSIRNKVDVFIGNHIIYYDFMPYISVIRHFDSRPIYFITMECLMKVPGLGILASNHILVDYNKTENFRGNCMRAIKNIDEGIIIILPEGKLRRPMYFEDSNKQCKKNNLPLLKNTIFPKIKGLYTIIDILREQNKLGHILDFTIYMEHFKPEDSMKEIVSTFVNEPFGNTFVDFEILELNESNINTYDNFKKWFIPLWYKKDSKLDYIINTNINNKEKLINEYTLYQYKLKSKLIIYFIITFLILLFFINNTNWIYIPISMISSIIFADLSYNRIKHIK